MANALEIRLLGPFEVVDDGRRVPVSGSKRDALLAVLALHRGRLVEVDALVAALWDEDLPSSPRNAIQHHVTRLRAVLGRDAIGGSADGYALNAASVDVVEFEELLARARAALREGDARAGGDAADEALALWRGSALHGLTDTIWFLAEARRLEALRVDALEEQFEAALALGEHREVVSAIRRALDDQPFRERLWGQLMLALYRSGRQAEALDTFQEARRVLGDELGLEPGPELRQLQEAILMQDAGIAPVPAAGRRRGNLPAPSTSFVGREPELATVVALLRERRLVTLTGPPGVGKSRLALEAARALEGETPDGAWMVELARAGSDTDVARLLARAVGTRGSDTLERSVARLRDAEALVVLDASEHVLEATRAAAETLLRECPRVRLLVTSREVLHVTGEVRVPVEPLVTISQSDDEAPAVELFLERARAARPGFELGSDGAALVAEISRLLDGLPLGIEIAAARVNALGLHELLTIVQGRLDLLEDRPPSDAARSALGALVEWSYDVLHADEKALLHALAVHRGGASLPSLAAAAGAHGLDEATVTYLLGALVDKSIISVSFPADSSRYDVLDTVRAYVLERLESAGGLDAARQAHAEYFAALADEARYPLRGSAWSGWKARLDLEIDNLWAALEHVTARADGPLALRLGTGLAWYFVISERVSEGRRFVDRALAAADDGEPGAALVELLAFACYLRTEEGDFDSAVAAGERAIALATLGGDPKDALAQTALALALTERGEAERAGALAADAYGGLTAAGDDWTAASVALLRALVAARSGDAATVAEMAAAARRHAAAVGFAPFHIPALILDAWVAERRGDDDAAASAYTTALELSAAEGFPDHAAFALTALGLQALQRGDLRRAEELERRALAVANHVAETWAGAHARVALARVLHAGGDAETAAALLRGVCAWCEQPRTHEARESLFLALAGDPADAAAAALAELGSVPTPV
ncbi:MAG TPA: BTAD domain-containing putative transcriptional regulator [Gaiellaceae bacterium]|nr:BTAD domain-containing putative transcriptional regulator [Gaiellaceae bacterium]